MGKRGRLTAPPVRGLCWQLSSWAVFAVAMLLLMEPYVRTSATSLDAVSDAVLYGNIVCVGSIGIFLESIWTRSSQAGGNMRRPCWRQIAGALTNIVLDPILIFGLGPVPRMGIAGAAAATVAGQCVAAVLTGAAAFRRPPKARVMWKYVRQIYRLGYPSIFMQMLYTVYIMALNMILAGFSDDAVTVLGLYYKLQSFFFIPLNGLQTCIVPILSYNFACLAYDRCKRILYDSCGISLVFMLVGVVSFECIPDRLIGLFSQEPAVLAIGVPAFRVIGLSFIPAVLSLMPPVFFQAIGAAGPSLLLSVVRQICCLIPLFWLFSKISLGATWFAYPLSEVITGSLALPFISGSSSAGSGRLRWRDPRSAKTAGTPACFNLSGIAAIWRLSCISGRSGRLFCSFTCFFLCHPV